MRKEKKLTLKQADGTDKLVEIREIRVPDLRDLLTQLDPKTPVDQLAAKIDAWLPVLTNLKLEELELLYPSEIEEVFQAVLEVNGSFFAVARTLGMEPALRLLQTVVSGSLIGRYADLFGTATSPETSSDTAGPSS